jgi:predicted SAM-dependent methyltransferase
MAYQAMRLQRRMRSMDQRLITGYFAQHSVRKLHIGCGTFVLDGWLNTDLHPKQSSVVQLDATQPFPLPSNSVDVIYSQHMIEHVPYDGGLALLKEAHRVLKPGGLVRIATPDLQFLLNVYSRPEEPVHERYVVWSIERHIPNAPYVNRAFVFNNYFRDWGHSFIYDEPTLRTAMQMAGFPAPERYALNQSAEPTLSNLSCADTQDEFLVLETMTLEARKP